MKIRIAVAVAPNGQWNAYGWSGNATDDEIMALVIEPLDPGERRYWVEAEVDFPQVETISGTAQEVK